MPHNFADSLKIDGSGHIAPTGPAKPAEGETELEFYIWVAQRHAFMHCEAELVDTAAVMRPGSSEYVTAWVMKPGTEEYEGRFVPGPAVGYGTAVSVRDGETVTFWWGEELQLT